MARKGTCIKCGNITSRFKVKTCRKCYIESIKVSDEEKKAYKAKYFQDNKELIKKRRRLNPIPKNKVRQYNFKCYYGISLEEYKKLLISQNNCCLICETSHVDNGKPKERLYVDHNHKTNKVRGLICFKCNTALGHFDDDINLLRKAIKYMEEHDN